MTAPRMRVSASRLSVYMDCALQARFKYIDRLPSLTNAHAAFGSCVHFALADYNRIGSISHAIDVFKKAWNDPDTIGSGIDVWPSGINFSGAKQRGIDMLNGFHEKQQWEPRDILAIEHKFLVPFGSYEITGAVDCAEVKKSGKGKSIVRIVDYKTNRRQPFRNALSLNHQFTLYDYAAHQKEFWVGNGDDFLPLENGLHWWEMLKDVPKRGVWYHLETQREFDVGIREQIDYMRAYRVCQMMERAEKHNVFVPDISGDSCTFCPYTKECGIPVRDFDPDDDEDAWI